MKHAILCLVLCVGLTDAVYRQHIYGVVVTPLQQDDIESEQSFDNVMVRKAIRYSKTGSDELTAVRCFAVEEFRERTGYAGPITADIKHVIRNHWVPGFMPGEVLDIP